MKYLIGIVAVIVLLGLLGRGKNFGEGAPGFFYTSPTSVSSTVGIYNETNILTPSSGRGYVSFCNNSITANDAVYLGFNASSTRTSGIRIPTGSCYEMTTLKMFTGYVYAIASTATTSLLTIYK